MAEAAPGKRRRMRKSDNKEAQAPKAEDDNGAPEAVEAQSEVEKKEETAE